MTRQPRDKRRSRTTVKLTRRDEALLRALGRFRLARSSDVGRLFFPGRHRDVLAARLRRLYDAHYLETHVLDRAAENVYSLGREGQAWLRARGVAVGAVPRPPWHHHLGIVWLWSKTAAAVNGVEGLRLIRFVPDWDAREQGGATGLEVVPDAVVDVAAVGDGRRVAVRVLAELDRGTESVEVLRRKLHALAARPGAPGSVPSTRDLVLVVMLDEAGRRREGKMRDLLASEWPQRARLWTDETDLVAELQQLLGIAATPATDSRHGNGRERAANADPPMLPPVAGGGPSADE